MKKEHNPEYINSTNQNKLINLELVPTNPGCYLFYDNKGKIIYIGKANNLRSRIRTYYKNADNRYHIRFLLSRAQRIDYIITNSEREALLLENTLIKRHKPRYNIRLKDDKNYLSLRLDPSDDFPRLILSENLKKIMLYTLARFIPLPP
jgi:excinuclease ABC subunit C